MKQILRIFAVVGVILLTALISAGSCDKKKAGDGDSKIVVTAKEGVAKVNGDKITILASKFPTAAAGVATDHVKKVVDGADTVRAEAFSVTYDKATAGMVVGVAGTVTDIKTIEIPMDLTVTAYPNTEAADKNVNVVMGSAAAGLVSVGVNVFSPFASKTAADNAFTAAADIQPVLICKSAIAFTAAPKATDKLTGGQKATCYVAALGAKPLGGNEAAW